MFKIGDVISVSKKGICKVENISKNVYEGCDKTKLYYTLRPINEINNMVVYFPTDTKLSMREIISEAEAINAINLIDAKDEIDAFTAKPTTSEINSVVNKIWEGIGKTAKATAEAEKVAAEQNAAKANIEDIFSVVDTGATVSEDTNIF